MEFFWQTPDLWIVCWSKRKRFYIAVSAEKELKNDKNAQDDQRHAIESGLINEQTFNIRTLKIVNMSIAKLL